MRGSSFTLASGPRAKWTVFALWLLAIFVAAGPANLPGKFEEAENNEASSYLPGDAESTTALEATEELQDGEIAPAVIVYRRDSGLTAADRSFIAASIARLNRTSEEFPEVVEENGRAFGRAIASPDGKAAIVTAEINAEGEGEAILDPVEAWREEIADPPAGLAAKVLSLIHI